LHFARKVRKLEFMSPGSVGVNDTEIDAVLAACRVLVAISARSIAVEHQADVAQFRALVILASRGSVSLGELSSSAGLKLSTASRMCDRMVVDGLVNRADDPANRRQLVLTLTDRGRGVVAAVARRRRAALGPMLARMPKSHRVKLVEMLSEFTATGGEPADRDLWTMGWTT
jgi:DNA-binding MarR family transcriptional regulator